MNHLSIARGNPTSDTIVVDRINNQIWNKSFFEINPKNSDIWESAFWIFDPAADFWIAREKGKKISLYKLNINIYKIEIYLNKT